MVSKCRWASRNSMTSSILAIPVSSSEAFVGSFALAAVVVHIMLLIRGAEGAWYLFAYFVVQAGFAAVLSYRTVQAKVAVEEGVKYTAEPIVAPIVFGLAYTFLLYNMRDILYV